MGEVGGIGVFGVFGVGEEGGEDGGAFGKRGALQSGGQVEADDWGFIFGGHSGEFGQGGGAWVNSLPLGWLAKRS